MPVRLLTVNDLAGILAKPKSFIYDHLDSLPPHVRIGRQLRWRPEAVDAWLDALAGSQ